MTIEASHGESFTEPTVPNPETGVDQELLKSVVDVIFEQSLKIKEGDRLLVIMDASGMRLADAVKNQAQQMGVEVKFRFYASELGKLLIEDPVMDMPGYPEAQTKLLLGNKDEENDLVTKTKKLLRENHAEDWEAARAGVLPTSPEIEDYFDKDNIRQETRRMGLMQLPPEAAQYRGTPNETTAAIHHGTGTDQAEDAYFNKFLTIRKKIASGRKFNIQKATQKEFDSVTKSSLRFRNSDGHRYVLIYQPDQIEADNAHMTLDQYEKMYYKAILNNWEKMREVQNRLIDYLDGKEKFEVHAIAPAGFPEGWDTHLTMSIKNMRFCNSTIDTNLPGSESFAAPEAGTLNGTLAIPHVVMFKERPLPNVKLFFKDGAVVMERGVGFDVHYEDPDDPRKKDDLDYIEEVLNEDKGSRICGELGIGTNPDLYIPSANSLLDEKAGGTVHLAMGESYANFQEESRIDNGNRSINHFDLTRFLQPAYGGGSIIVDGEVIQENGKWKLPQLDYLNGNKEAA